VVTGQTCCSLDGSPKKVKYTWVRYVYSRNQKNLPAGSIYSQAQSHNSTDVLTVLVLNEKRAEY